MNEQPPPVAYGYMRAGSQTTDDQITRARAAVADYAEVHGFALAEMYVEDDIHVPHRQFNALIEALAKRPAGAVIMPTVLDLRSSPATRLWTEQTLRGKNVSVRVVR